MRRHSRVRLVGLVMLALVALADARLVFAHTPVDHLALARYEAAVRADPAHSPLYRDAYRLYRDTTGASALHYGVHRLAEHVALLSGHPGAATTQAVRASYHRPPAGPLAGFLRGAWQDARRALSG